MKRNGFTLIELLAVIIILAIIALIVVPLLFNAIKDARKSSAERSASNYIDAVEKQASANIILDRNNLLDGVYNIPIAGVSVKGSTPTNGWVAIESGQVINYSFVIDGYVITKDEETVIGDNAKPRTYNLGDLVYFDPVSSSACNESTFTGTNTCYKWRVIETEDSMNNTEILLQMDHNLINKSAWSPTSTSTGPVTALEALNAATVNWSRVDNLNYTYDTSLASNNYGTMNCTDGNCTLNGIAVNGIAKARMITIEEIAKITNTNANVPSNAISRTYNLSKANYFYFSKTTYLIGTLTVGEGNVDLA